MATTPRSTEPTPAARAAPPTSPHVPGTAPQPPVAKPPETEVSVPTHPVVSHVAAAPALGPEPLKGDEAIADLQRRMDRLESLMPVAVGLPLPPLASEPVDDDLEHEIAAKEAELAELRRRRETGGVVQEWPKWTKDGAGNDVIAESPEHESELKKQTPSKAAPPTGHPKDEDDDEDDEPHPRPQPHPPSPPPSPAPRPPRPSGTQVAG